MSDIPSKYACPECGSAIDEQGYCINAECVNHAVGRDYAAYAEFLPERVTGLEKDESVEKGL